MEKDARFLRSLPEVIEAIKCCLKKDTFRDAAAMSPPCCVW